MSEHVPMWSDIHAYSARFLSGFLIGQTWDARWGFASCRRISWSAQDVRVRPCAAVCGQEQRIRKASANSYPQVCSFARKRASRSANELTVVSHAVLPGSPPASSLQARVLPYPSKLVNKLICKFKIVIKLAQNSPAPARWLAFAVRTR